MVQDIVARGLAGRAIAGLRKGWLPEKHDTVESLAGTAPAAGDHAIVTEPGSGGLFHSPDAVVPDASVAADGGGRFIATDGAPWVRKYAPGTPVSPLWWAGASPDGATDNAVPLARAFAAAAENGETVTLATPYRSARWSTNEPLRLGGSLTLDGGDAALEALGGFPATIDLETPTGSEQGPGAPAMRTVPAPLLLVEGSASSGVTLKSLTLDGGGNAAVGLMASGIAGLTIDAVAIVRTSHAGIVLAGCRRPVLTGMTLHECGAYGIRLVNGVTDGVFTACDSTGQAIADLYCEDDPTAPWFGFFGASGAQRCLFAKGVWASAAAGGKEAVVWMQQGSDNRIVGTQLQGPCTLAGIHEGSECIGNIFEPAGLVGDPARTSNAPAAIFMGSRTILRDCPVRSWGRESGTTLADVIEVHGDATIERVEFLDNAYTGKLVANRSGDPDDAGVVTYVPRIRQGGTHERDDLTSAGKVDAITRYYDTDARREAVHDYRSVVANKWGDMPVYVPGSTILDLAHSGDVDLSIANETRTVVTGTTGQRAGQRLTLRFADANTVIAHGGTFRIGKGADYVSSPQSVRSFVCVDAASATWVEEATLDTSTRDLLATVDRRIAESAALTDFGTGDAAFIGACRHLRVMRREVPLVQNGLTYPTSPIFIPPGDYEVTGGFGEYLTSPLFWAIPGTVTIRITGDHHLFELYNRLDCTWLHGITTIGGRGLLRHAFTGVNVAWHHVIEDCRMIDYQGAAIVSEATDIPFWQVRRNHFFALEGGSLSKGLALGGLLDASVIEDNQFARNDIHLQLGPIHSGNFIVRHNTFLSFEEDRTDRDIWLMPNDTAGGFGTNAGGGILIVENKFGNESIVGAAKKAERILIAAKGPDSREACLPDFGWKTGDDGAHWLFGMRIADNRISTASPGGGEGPDAPFLKVCCEKVDQIEIARNDIDGGRFTWLVEHADDGARITSKDNTNWLIDLRTPLNRHDFVIHGVSSAPIGILPPGSDGSQLTLLPPGASDPSAGIVAQVVDSAGWATAGTVTTAPSTDRGTGTSATLATFGDGDDALYFSFDLIGHSGKIGWLIVDEKLAASDPLTELKYTVNVQQNGVSSFPLIRNVTVAGTTFTQRMIPFVIPPGTTYASVAVTAPKARAGAGKVVLGNVAVGVGRSAPSLPPPPTPPVTWVELGSGTIADDFTLTTSATDWLSGVRSAVARLGDVGVRSGLATVSSSPSDGCVIGLGDQQRAYALYDIPASWFLGTSGAQPFLAGYTPTSTALTGLAAGTLLEVRRRAGLVEWLYYPGGNLADPVVHHAIPDPTEGAALFLYGSAYAGGSSFGPVVRSV